MKTLIGKIISLKMSKTAAVLVEGHKTHPLYHKKYRADKKYHADTNKLELKDGDKVKIEECRPISKTKTWKVVENYGTT